MASSFPCAAVGQAVSTFATAHGNELVCTVLNNEDKDIRLLKGVYHWTCVSDSGERTDRSAEFICHGSCTVAPHGKWEDLPNGQHISGSCHVIEAGCEFTSEDTRP